MSSVTTRLKVSIIIPSWTGEVSHLMQSIKQQTLSDYEVIVIQGVSPAACARNLGATQARADILFFLDDDAYLGHENVLQMMIDVLECDAQTGIVGAAQRVPIKAHSFQYAVARQVPRYESPIVSENQVSNPPLDSYGFTAITSMCCVLRQSLFEEVGGFDESLMMGEDPDLFYRVRQRGYNLVIAANCWVYHDPPANLKVLLLKNFWYGVGHVMEAHKSPERGMALLPLNRWWGHFALIAVVIGFPFSFFVHYYFSPVRRLVFSFRPLKTLATYAVLCGYVYGWYRSKPHKVEATLHSNAVESAKVQIK